MWRTQRFDYRVARCRTSFRLELLLQHCFVISLCCGEWIRAFKFVSKRMTNKMRRCFETTVEKDRSRNRLEHISQKRVLLTAATLFLATPETQKLAKPQSLRSVRKRRRTNQTMLHAREFAFGATRIRVAEIVRHYQSEH